MTKYDNYNQYQDGDSWDYNPEMSRLFSDRVAKGENINRPSSTEAPTDAIWISTDESKIYRNDSTNGWVVEGHGTSGSPVPEGDYISLLTEVLEANSPTNLSNLIFPELDGGPSAFREGIVVQMGDDSASAGTVGYAAPVHFVTGSGERIGTIAGDKVHNHLGVYTRGSSFDGSDAQPVKRVNIGGGAGEVNIDWSTIDNFDIDGVAPEIHLFSDVGEDTKITQYEDGSIQHQIQWDASRNDVRFQHFTAATAGVDYMEIAGDEDQVEINWDLVLGGSAQTVGKGSATDPAIAMGGGGAGLFVNASGEVVVVDEAGNETILS